MAEERVMYDAEEDTHEIKSKFIENKVAITANKISKSLTYD